MLTEIGKRVKKASVQLSVATTDEKNRILKAIADALRENSEKIIKANEIDIQNGVNNGMSKALLDRLMLNAERIEGMAQGVEDVISLPDPVGKILWETERPNGLKIQRVSSPLGVVGIIYEARPNVTSDAAALCIKSGNTAILRGGKEAFNSNSAIMDVMRSAIEKTGFNPDIVELVRDTSRESSTALMRMNEYVGVLIPRGSANLINAGILPLTFKNEADYDKIDLNDELVMTGLIDAIENGKNIVITNKTKNIDIECECELSERAKKIALAGGLLSYTKEQM